MVLRLLPSATFSLEEPRLPPVIKDMLRRARGLVLVTGPTGSGKSTTLASMINWINENQHGHIITIEDPIEYTHHRPHTHATPPERPARPPTHAEGGGARVRSRPEIARHARQDIPGAVTRLPATRHSHDGAGPAAAALKAGGFACLVVAP